MSSQCSARYFAGFRPAHRQAEEKDDLRQQSRERNRGEQRKPSRRDVIGTGKRSNEIEVYHSIATVGTQKLGPDNCGKHEQDQRSDSVVIGERGKIFRRVLPAKHGRCADHESHYQRDCREHADEEPWKNFRATTTAKTECSAETVLIDRGTRARSTFARSVVPLISDVEDCSGHFDSLSKSSVSSRRRGAILRSGASASTIASRTSSYTDSSGPSIVRPPPVRNDNNSSTLKRGDHFVSVRIDLDEDCGSFLRELRYVA